MALKAMSKAASVFKRKKELRKFIRKSMTLVARKKEKLKPILGGMEAWRHGSNHIGPSSGYFFMNYYSFQKP